MILGSNNKERFDVVSVGEILIDFLPGEEEGSYIRNQLRNNVGCPDSDKSKTA